MRLYMLLLAGYCLLTVKGYCQVSTDRNFVSKIDIKKPGITQQSQIDALTLIKDRQQQISYFDGLGRPIQTVVVQGSNGNKDVVTAIEYDNYGREIKKFLPYADLNNGLAGTFRNAAFTDQSYFYNSANTSSDAPKDSHPFSQTFFEFSPINRALENGAAGQTWQPGSGHVVKQLSLLNTVNDKVRQWSAAIVSGGWGTYTTAGEYAANDLLKTITIDEQNKQVIEFKDREGKVILKKVQVSATPGTEDDGTGRDYTGWLSTYYIYDDVNNLRCVVQPAGVELLIANSWDITALSNDILNEQCFRYEYDSRNRMIMKKVPGAGEVYMVYDQRDRLVFTQDAKMRLPNQWLYTLYDELNRPTQTGMMVYSDNVNNLRAHVNGLTNTTITLATSGTNVDGNVATLILPQREPGITNYTATSEIQFLDGFESENNADFAASISSVPPTGFAGTTTTNINPIPLGATLTALTYTFYDNYEWTNKTYSTTDNNKVDAWTNPYAVPLPTLNNPLVMGQVTGTRIRVLDDPTNLSIGKWMESVSFYDEKMRTIQSKATNVTGGVDITTLLYDFSGKVLSSYINHEKLGGTTKTYSVATRNAYDDLGRPIKVEKKLNNIGDWKTVSELAYDALGQLKTKKLGTDPVLTPAPLETLTHDYNIRGWLLGVNRDYAKAVNSTSNYFGFDLGYDKTDIKASTSTSIGTFSTAAYNGNIGGMLWKSTGDDKVRKYDFTYDPVNRLTGANFKQYSTTNSIFDLTDGIDFTVSNLRYDANGNITSQQQQGWKLGGSVTIDNLAYNYVTNSNKLLNVIDGNNDINTKLGDFRYSNTYNTALGGTKTVAAADYAYDLNGSLTSDKNKDITGITYNHLNLPSIIMVAGKGSIEYIYDAAGIKLKKIVHETGKPDKTTSYLFGTYQDDILQFLPQEEGRIRFDMTTGAFPFDYFIKDHLGNVRMVLTDEVKQDNYPAATLETTPIANERIYYSGLDTGRVNKTSVSGYPIDNTTSPNDFIQKLNGNGAKIGSSMVLKVMAGDKFNVKVSSWYKSNGVNPGPPANPLTDLVTALTNGVVSAATGGGKAFSVPELQNSNVLSPNVTSFLTDPSKINPVTTRPKAYLNWILFDEQFRYVSISSGAEQVPDEIAFGDIPNQLVYNHVKSNLPIDKNGYLYVYVSNETPNIDVFFDNLQVTQIRGPILEETHYYPFGLTMSGISSKAAGIIQNKDKTFQGQRFDDDFGLNWVQFKWRNHDPQIGRFIEIDPLSEKYVYNSTYAFSENKVTSHVELEGLESVFFNQLWGQVKSEFSQTAAKIDQTISHLFSISTYIPNKTVSAGPVTVTNGTTITNTSTTTSNLKGHVDYIMNNNTIRGDSEPATKTSNTTTATNDTKTTVNGKLITGGYNSSTDINGNTTNEASGSIRRKGIEIGGAVSGSSTGVNTEVNASVTTGPITLKAFVIGALFGTGSAALNTEPSIQLGGSVEVKKGNATITTSSSIQIKL
ncbi:MAG: repeat-associated core domain protein [Segetibacter sp.]|nr:repeat-associated core domain protein [Segetibacter sp.]